MTRSPELTRLAEYWQTLTPATLDAIATVYAEDAYFRDPFNEVTGIEKIRHIFADMFVRLDEPRFTILETIEQLNGNAGEGVRGAFMIWDFTFRIKTLKPELVRKIHGTSHIRFAADGRVQYHCDYWDAAGELYEQLPIVGALMRYLKKRAG
ncbi:MAG: nuclear transport factor 2 family protein [Usitatibacteraceae bacterium]